MAEGGISLAKDFPCRVEGWLNVWDVDPDITKSPYLDGQPLQPVFEPFYCVLLQDQKTLSAYKSEKIAEERCAYKEGLSRIRLDGGKEEFDRRWGYETLESIKENAIQHSCAAETSYEKAVSIGLERRGSLPVVSRSLEDNMDASSNGSFKFSTFFSKKGFKSNLKRTKSATKLDRRRYPGTPDGADGENKFVSSLKRSMSLSRLTRRRRPKFTLGGLDQEDSGNSSKTVVRPCHCTAWSPQQNQIWNLINSQMRTSRSHESLLHPTSSMHAIDLTAPDIEIKPLHSSILGQEHCFQVSTSNGTKYYSCRTAEERQKWIECLRKTVHPDQEQTPRTDNSLHLWILEAKNVQTKKKYFCEVCLDRTLYARTSSKAKGDILFWGEQFDFSALPEIEIVTVNIYREADKKKKKDKNQLLGYVNIPVQDISSRQLTEKWYTASSGTVGRAAKENRSELPLIRIRAKYQTIQILPMDTYQEFIKYISSEYFSVVEALEPVISVKAKEHIATSLVSILHKLDKAQAFLTDVVGGEVDRLDNEHMTFRGNSIATKSMEAYLKLMGEKYLKDTLGDFIKTVLDSTDDCEVDPTKVPHNTTLQRHQTNLVMYSEMAWVKIINSACYFPSELRDVFAGIRTHCADKGKEDISDNLISASIFLRFLCPAIMSPSLFGLTQEFPGETAARNLTLIAKTIQNLANFTRFGGKEEYMVFMNDFVEREWGTMKNFLKQISSQAPASCHSYEFDGYIDLGKELSILHSLLAENLEKFNKSTDHDLNNLKEILDDLSEALKNPQSAKKLSTACDSSLQTDVSDIVHTTQNSGYSPSADSSALLNYNGRLGDGYHSTPRTRPAQDLNTSDDYVMFTALHENDSRYSPSASNHQPSGSQQVVNQSWNTILRAAELVNGEYVDLISYMDDVGEERRTDGSEVEDNVSQSSVSQISTVTSGYQSVGANQSLSPLQKDQETSVLQPLSFSNPVYNNNHLQNRRTLPKRESSFSSISSTEDTVRTSQSQTNSQPSSWRAAALSCSSSDSLYTPPRDRKQSRKPSESNTSHYARVQPSTKVQRYKNGPASIDSKPVRFTGMAGMRSHQFSKSADAALYSKARQVPELKRTCTDSAIALSAIHTTENPPAVFGCRRSSLPQGPVHMGIKSVQRKIHDQRGKMEYEQELNSLRQQLLDAEARLQEAEQHLKNQNGREEELRKEWQTKLEESEQQLKAQQAEKDQQMKSIIQRLISVEEELRQEHSEMQKIVAQKQKMIDSQDRRIRSLDAANTRLMTALHQLREQYRGKNGLCGRVTLTDDLKTSSC